jgi:hypothetical protein
LVGLALAAALSLAVVDSLRAGEAGPVSFKEIRVKAEGEKLVVEADLTGRLTPTVKGFDLKGGQPRIIVDFPGATGRKGLPAHLKSPSPLASAVRLGLHPGPKPMVRLVIDLTPGRLYRVEQWFRRDLNRYVLVLSAKGG